MDSIMTFLDSSSMAVSPQRPTIYSLETMLIEVNSHLKPSAFFSLTKSNTQKTSSCSEEITSAQALTESMGFMTSANDDTTLSFGKHSQTVSIAFQLLLLLMKRSYACMEDFPLSFQTWNKSEELWDLLMFQTQDCFVTCSGQIQKRTSRDGRRTIEESVSFSVLTLLACFWRNTTLISFVELIRLLRMAMNFSPSVNLSPYFQRLITAVSLITLAQWCLLTTLSCVHSRS